VLFGVFFLLPLGLIVAYSFWETVDYNVVHHWTLGNYRYFFSVPTYVTRTWVTLWVAIVATAATIGAAFPFVYWLVRYVRRGALQRLLLVLVILPFWTSYLLRVYSWLNILGDQGAINRFLQWTHITHHPLTLSGQCAFVRVGFGKSVVAMKQRQANPCLRALGGSLSEEDWMPPGEGGA